MNLDDLKKALEKSWCKETCYPGLMDDWSEENPSLGQCAVTCLVVQDYLGGDILYCKHLHHYWNEVDGEEIDFTRDQFKNKTVCMDEKRTRVYLLNSKGAREARTPERYELLKERVELFLDEKKD